MIGNKLDTLFICLFMVIIAIIIGINIISMIDKKISNVSVNVPPVNVPKSTIIINLEKQHINYPSFGQLIQILFAHKSLIPPSNVRVSDYTFQTVDLLFKKRLIRENWIYLLTKTKSEHIIIETNP